MSALAMGLLKKGCSVSGSDLVKNNVPNYAYVSDFVKGLRKYPVGNFVSFPAEMLRTGATAIKMSLVDIASDNPALRQMGYKQLMGAYLAVYGIGKGLSALSYYATGSRREEWEAYHRKTKRFIPGAF